MAKKVAKLVLTRYEWLRVRLGLTYISTKLHGLRKYNIIQNKPNRTNFPPILRYRYSIFTLQVTPRRNISYPQFILYRRSDTIRRQLKMIITIDGWCVFSDTIVINTNPNASYYFNLQHGTVWLCETNLRSSWKRGPAQLYYDNEIVVHTKRRATFIYFFWEIKLFRD